MTAALAEINRRLENLVRPGVVASVRHDPPAVRVSSGGITTDWLPWIAPRAGATREWNPPTAGEQCVVLSPSGEPAGGVVLVGLFSSAVPAPSSSGDEHVIAYPDGARISYNHRSGALVASGVKTATVEASDLCLVDCPKAEFSGDVLIRGTLEVEKLLTYKSGMQGSGGAAGGTSITGPFTHTDGQLSSNNVVLDSHTHSGVQPGGGNTGGPR